LSGKIINKKKCLQINFEKYTFALNIKNMKKLSIILSALVMAAFLVTSCSKDQKSANRLEGDWKVTYMSADGEAADKEDYEGTTYTFKKCKVKKGDCEGSISYNDPDKGNVSMPFVYNVSDKGEKLKITTTFMGFSTTTNYTITDQTKTTIELEATQDGTKIVQKMEKK
jgi:hypothetical protein